MDIQSFASLVNTSKTFIPSPNLMGLKSSAPVFTMESPSFNPSTPTPLNLIQEEPKPKKKTRRGTKGAVFEARMRRRECKGKTPSEIIS